MNVVTSFFFGLQWSTCNLDLTDYLLLGYNSNLKYLEISQGYRIGSTIAIRRHLCNVIIG